jgi:hypothetical protein
MYLRDLSVYAEQSAEPPPGRTWRAFNKGTHTPVEAYLDCLPRKVMLGNLAKVNVILGPRPPNEEAYSAAFNVAELYYPRFNFGRYFSLSRGQQQKRIAEILHKALVSITDRTNSDRTPFDKAYACVMCQSFPLPDITDFEMRCRLGLLSRAEKRKLKRRRAPRVEKPAPPDSPRD